MGGALSFKGIREEARARSLLTLARHICMVVRLRSIPSCAADELANETSGSILPAVCRRRARSLVDGETVFRPRTFLYEVV